MEKNNITALYTRLSVGDEDRGKPQTKPQNLKKGKTVL